MDTREYHLVTTGKCISAINDYKLDYILDQATESLSEGDYNMAIISVITNTNYVLYNNELGVSFSQSNPII